MWRPFIKMLKRFFYYIRSGDIDGLKLFFEDEENMKLLFPPFARQSVFRASLRAAELIVTARPLAASHPLTDGTGKSLIENFTTDTEAIRNVAGVLKVFERYVLEMASRAKGVLKYNRQDYSPLVRHCIEKIMELMPERVSLSELSASLHVTPRYLSTLFNRDTGTSISDFMQEIRIDEAKYMLSNSDMDYPEISNILCYGSQSYFNQVFKKKVGLTPREFRLRERTANEGCHNHQ